VYYNLGQRETIAERQKMHDISNEDFKGAGFSSIYPAGEFSADVTDTLDFLQIAGAQPHSFWLLDGFQDTPSMKVLRLSTSIAKPAQPSGSQAELTALRDTLAGIKNAVKVLKEL
jgi:hypothetical protein